MSVTLTPERVAAQALAETILEHGVDNAGALLNKLLQSIAIDNIRWLRNTPFDLPRKEGHREASVATTMGLQLEALGLLEAYAASTRVRITARSIARYRLANAILSLSGDGLRPRIRLPSARYAKSVRPRTAAELAGLKRGNEQRAEQARRRRALEHA